MREYVIGFLFDQFDVLLQYKDRPEIGLKGYNGIGGKVEDDELPLDAMVREAFEEVDLVVPDFKLFAIIYDRDVEGQFFILYLYQARVNNLEEIQQKTPEGLKVRSRFDLPPGTIDDVKWMIPMSYDNSRIHIVQRVQEYEVNGAKFLHGRSEILKASMRNKPFPEKAVSEEIPF